MNGEGFKLTFLAEGWKVRQGALQDGLHLAYGMASKLVGREIADKVGGRLN